MRRLLLGLGVVMTSAVIAVTTAQASCAGTVVELANAGHRPTFAVEEIVGATIVERDEPIVPGSEPDAEDDSPPYVMIALTTVLVAGGCLYLLFRRGSIAYRARQDEERSSEE
jgi:hypothetical protein